MTQHTPYLPWLEEIRRGSRGTQGGAPEQSLEVRETVCAAMRERWHTAGRTQMVTADVSDV